MKATQVRSGALPPSPLMLRLGAPRYSTLPASPYVPAFVTKRGELKALQLLPSVLRPGVAPLISVRPIKPATKRRHPKTGKTIIKKRRLTYTEHLLEQLVWLGNLTPPRTPRKVRGSHVFSAIYVDVAILQRQELTHDVLVDVLNGLGPEARWFVPVTDCNRQPPHQFAARDWHLAHGTGIALRIRAGRTGAWPALQDLVSTARLCGCAPAETDLIVDLGFVDQHAAEDLPSTVSTVVLGYCGLPWRTLTLLSGAFPKSIANLSSKKTALPRHDLILWKRVTFVLKTLGARLPRFGDYGMVHPKFLNGGKPAQVNPNIRYTDERVWDVYRRPRTVEVQAMCQDITADHPHALARANIGDEWIADRVGQQPSTPGNPESWTRTGLAHHAWFAARQMAGLT